MHAQKVIRVVGRSDGSLLYLIDVGNDAVRFDCIKCGRVFSNVALAIEVSSENPLVRFPDPTGVKLVSDVCDEIKRGVRATVR